MSQRVVRYSRPNAELRGMIARLLSAEQLQVLAASPELEGVLRALSDTPYRAGVTGILERGVTLAAAERAVLSSLVDAHRRAALLVQGGGVDLVLEMARRMELDNLKAILRAKARGEPAEAVRPLLVPLGGLSDLPIEELLRAEDPEAVARGLAQTEYDRVLLGTLPRYATEHSLFPVEIALDLHYYRQLWSVVQGLRGLDRRVVDRIMGIRYDALNVDWIIRYRLVYRLSPEEVFNYTLPYGRRIDDDDVRRAASSEGIDGIAAALPDPYRALLLSVTRGPDPVGQAGVALQRYLVAVARSSLAGYPFHLGVAVAYLWLKESEVHDLRAIMEGKHCDRPADRIVERMWGAR